MYSWTVECRTDITYAGSEMVEQLPIERLVPQLIEDAPGVFVGCEVVARLAALALPGVHARWQRCSLTVLD
ncbi:hypothetical protein [Petrachloros mirabilis]